MAKRYVCNHCGRELDDGFKHCTRCEDKPESLRRLGAARSQLPASPAREEKHTPETIADLELENEALRGKLMHLANYIMGNLLNASTKRAAVSLAHDIVEEIRAGKFFKVVRP